MGVATLERLRHKERTRELLLTSAVKLFAESGFDGISVQDIVDDAGVNKRLVYYYFGEKEGLFLAAVANAYSKLSRQWLPRPVGDVQQAVAEAIEFLCGDLEIARLLELDVGRYGFTARVKKSRLYETLRSAASRSADASKWNDLDAIYLATLQITRVNLLGERPSPSSFAARRNLAARLIAVANV